MDEGANKKVKNYRSGRRKPREVRLALEPCFCCGHLFVLEEEADRLRNLLEL